MKILVLGATGRTGRRAVQEALSRGHEVTALVRREGSAPAGTKEIVGDVTSEATLKEVADGHDAVLIALAGNPQQGYDILSGAAQAVVNAMASTGTRRVVMICSSGILDAEDGGYRGKNLAEEFKPIFREHLKAYEIFRSSEVDWTTLCPPNLPDGDYTGDFVATIEAFPDDESRQAYTGDVAHLMIDVLDDERTFAKRMGVVSRKPR